MTAVLLFARAPRRGHVKTRLARDIGDARALAIYRRLGAHMAAAVRRRYRLTVWFDPPDAEREMRVWLGDAEYLAQCEGDLGARLGFAFHHHFGRGDVPVIAIGTDAPGLDDQTLDEASRLLLMHDAVVGPAVDGGYYLIGLRRMVDAVFADIPWGGPRVMGVTLEVLANAHLTVGRLPMLRDVDTAADLAALGLPPT